ncbi:MAG: hypothetical protein NPINA01_22770 [Nitrospinaceae bacterium]|nr:MAG: hypothetical protein NPINA01_22770 [Nitrospinaceae bacterium]
MEKLEAVQKVLRFCNTTRDWVTREHSVYFDDFDEQNVDDYEPGGYGELADAVIEKGIQNSILDEEDVDEFLS